MFDLGIQQFFPRLLNKTSNYKRLAFTIYIVVTSCTVDGVARLN